MNDHKGVRWDLRSYFPEFNGTAMKRFKADLQRDISQLKHKSQNLKKISTETSRKWESLFLSAEDISRRLGHLSSYLSCLEAADTEHEAYPVERAGLVRLYAAFEKIDIDIQKAFKRIPKGLLNDFCSRPKMKGIAYHLNRTRERARHTMSSKEEALASDLKIDGLSAWGRLYDRMSGKLEFDYVGKDGSKERRPISQWRSLISNPDRAVGRAAFEGGNRAWQKIEDACGAALNAIAGSRLTLYRHRRVDHFLDQALFGAAIDDATLEAMYRSVHQNIDISRDILRAKARFFGRKGIWFFEREAPLPLTDATTFTWPQAVGMVQRAFETQYPGLSSYFQGMVASRWIESEARPGKRPGAFCTGSSISEEQRVYMTYTGTLGDVTTLAHEVGHAWHGHLLKNARPFARRYPMTLAETASIFTEQLLIEGLKVNAALDAGQKLGLLDNELTDAAIFLLDITTRYEFEKAFYEERQKGELPVSRLKALMGEAQRKVYGDALLDGGEDPYFWASKLHFFITDTAFYNFPYTFGYLLARAMIHRFRLEGAAFLPRYESFLRMSGSGTVEEVSRKTLNIELGDPAFWTQAIKSLEDPLRRYREEIAQAPRG